MLAGGESVFGTDRFGIGAGNRHPRDRARSRHRAFSRRWLFLRQHAAAALVSVHLDIRAGELIALVGPSGAGKTTLINLVARFIEPTSGAIELDGVPIRELTRASLRRQIALVSQDVVLFDDTIAANIAYGETAAHRRRPFARRRSRLPVAVHRKPAAGFQNADRRKTPSSSPAASASGSRSRARC